MAKSRTTGITKEDVANAVNSSLQRQLDGSKAIQGSRYVIDRSRLMKKDKKEGPVMLTNFVAYIAERQIFHDGSKSTTYFRIEGERHNSNDPEEPFVLPAITVAASDFKSLSWVMEKWGSECIVFPESNATADVATAIQLMSKPKQQDIYTHTGWSEVNGKKTFLHYGGGITAEGHDPAITVQLPNELQRYRLPAPKPETYTEALRQSLRLVNIGPPQVMWPMLLATFRAAIMEADFAIHLAGRTGSFKSEVASLFQSHFGHEMDARHLPASWSATANALEALTYRTMNALIVIDDYVPVGSAHNIKALDGKVDQVIRAQGNQQGRARMGDAAMLQQTYYPRGIIFSTGEDIPNGHSIRGRMTIIEIERGDIAPDKLTIAQKARPWYPQSMANWIHWLANEQPANEVRDVAAAKRDTLLSIGHSRTPAMLGQLIATAELLERFALKHTKIERNVASKIAKMAEDAILIAGNNQTQYLQTADPVNAFADTIRTLVGSDKAHFKTTNGGAPANAGKFGWKLASVDGEHERYAPSGMQLGWVNVTSKTLYINADLIASIIGRSGGKIALTEATLLKRLTASGLIKRRDVARQRNTLRMTAEGVQRNVIELDLDQIFPADEPTSEE